LPNNRTVSETVRFVLLRPEAAAAGGTIAVFLGFGLTTNLFLTQHSFINITNVVADLGIVSVGITLLMIGGQFDLSIGAVIGLSSFAAAHLTNEYNLPPLAAIAAALAFSAVLGALNGLMVVTTKIHSFIVTLGTMMIYRGLLTACTKGFPMAVETNDTIRYLLAGPIHENFQFRMSLVWLLLAIMLGTWLLVRTRTGNWIYAIGQNKEAARNLGIPVKRLTVALFALASFTGGCAGVIQMARFQSVDALRGEGDELNVIAMAVIGGTSLMGGYGSVIGTAFGALIFGMVQQGLVLMGAPGFYFKTLVGVVLLGAVLVNTFVTNKIMSQKTPKPQGETEPDQ